MSRIPKTDYSKVAEYYDKVKAELGGLLSKIIEYGRIDSKTVVLDVGCGTGRFSANLSNLTNCWLFGLELSPEMLRKAAAKDTVRRVTWVRGDGHRLPFLSQAFDCVYMTFVMHHLEDKELALREIHRVLKKKGRCVVVTISHSQIRRDVLNDFPGVTAIDLKRFPSVPSIERKMLQTSFRDVHYHVSKRLEQTPVDKYLERVRNKYASTLTLFSEEEFQRRFRVFQQRVQRKYGGRLERLVEFIFVVAEK
jgi:ubiquinone/menaquinone biosynthesis C-methylase UbiE